MKCPVCDKVNTSMVCPKCGFDSSRDYGKYPTFGSVGKALSVSSLRQEWKQDQEEPVVNSPAPELPRKKTPWFTIAACAVTLALGIGISSGLGRGKPELKEPEDTVQMQEPPETTLPKMNEPVRDVTVTAPQLTNVLDSNNGTFSYSPGVFGSDYQRQQIKSVTFLDTLEEMPNEAWDASDAKNGRVMAWVKPDGELYDLYIGAEGGVWADHDCRHLFEDYVNVSEITFGDAFHTENVQDMENMFYECGSLISLDLSSFDTANVQDMNCMFFKCGSLTSLDLSGFDTANVQSMDRMFMDCGSLTSLDLSGFDTANVQDMDWMFYKCGGLTSLDLSSFDTTNVQEMENMFYECGSLTSLDLSSFDTANVRSLSRMFYKCENLTNLKLGGRFVTTNAYTNFMFDDCPAGADYQHLVH